MLTRKSLWVRLTLGQPRLMLMALAMLAGFMVLPYVRATHADVLPATMAAAAADAPAPTGSDDTTFHPFSFLSDPKFSSNERVALFTVLAVSLLGLLYAAFLVGVVNKADRGTPKMQEVAAAI